MEHATKSGSDQQRRSPADERTVTPGTGATFFDNRSAAFAQRELTEVISNGPRVLARQAVTRDTRNSPRVVAQRRQFSGMFGPVLQREAGRELPQGAVGRVPQEVSEVPQLIQSHPQSSQAIQRVIEITGDKTYRDGDAAALKEKYPEELEKILTGISANGDVANAPKTIESALSDKRHFVLKRAVHNRWGAWYELVNKADFEEPEVENSQEAGEQPVCIVRPRAGFEELVIKGLIMCVGIVIEALGEEDEVQAAAGSHFVTPDSMKEGKITERAQLLIQQQINLPRAHGVALKATLMSAKAAVETKTRSGAQKDADEAAALITAFLNENGVADVTYRPDGPSQSNYQLLANGKSTLNGGRLS